MILAFVVLLTVLVLAYFSYSSLQRQISSSSSNQATVDIFAQGAINSIVTDFKQEIAAGSSTNVYGTNKVYTPLASSNAAPVRVGTSANLPNLVKRSGSGLAFYPGGPARASAISSTNASQNGRSISPARWNQALLLAKADTNSTTDFTPANFTAPDWIYVNRGGGNPTSWSTALRWNSNPSDTNVVVGRYAYAIYDEGGLLDVNVAGYPPGTTNSIAGFKSPLAYADLTQVGLSTNVISALVGWRNAATAQPGGSFPNYTFSAASQTNFFKSVSTNSYGFMRTANNSMVSGETDRMFISRQHLLQFFDTLSTAGIESKASLQNALQYLGTFSRALDQPSFAPHRNRPKIIGSAAPPAADKVASYIGNNTGWGGDDVINPSFLSARVGGGGFTRTDGSQAVDGEPLINKRFPLQRLAYLTFEGPSSTASAATKTRLLNAGIPQSVIDAGTPENILKSFGLTWNAATKGWTYDHGIKTDAPSSQPIVGTLSRVVTAKRDADMPELLKAAINVGSIAKGGPNLHDDQGNDQYTVDTSVDYNILQIFANLVDQFDGDSFPTQIHFTTGGVLRTFRGVEDLPYFYRYHPMTVVTRLPSPLLAKTDQVEWRTGPPPVSGAAPAPVKVSNATKPGSALTDPGEAVYLYIPDLWNPHDGLAKSNSPTGLRPSRFRLTVVSRDPISATPLWNPGVISRLENDWYNHIPPNKPPYNSTYTCIPQSTAPLATEAATALAFSDNEGKLFREPTLLWRGDVPTGSSVGIDAGDSGSLAGPYTDVNTNVQYYGVQLGKTPISYVGKVDSNYFYGTLPSATDKLTPASPTGDYIFQGRFLEPIQDRPPGAFAQYTFRLQYKDPVSGGWITYDEKYPDFHGLSSPAMYVNKADYPNGRWKNPYVADQMRGASTGYDPRTPRFGIGTDTTLDWAGAPMLEPGAATNFNATTDAGNQIFMDTKPTVMVTQRPLADSGNRVNYSNPGMTTDLNKGRSREIRFFSGRGFSGANGDDTGLRQYDGLWSQNNPAILIPNRINTGNLPFFYEDPDGVARRAMGAYAIAPTLPVSKSSAAALSANLHGLPHATANTYASGSFGVGTETAQSQSRPMMLNRPFRSVSEMSYASRGGLWKQIDFFTPESGDTALLDVFCINETPKDAVIAGKVNLNTRQSRVIQAIVNGGYREELANMGVTVPAGTVTAPLSQAEAAAVAAKLVGITTDETATWRGPLSNVGDLVGRYVENPGSTGAATDVYSFVEPVTSQTYTYAGISAALDSTVYSSSQAAIIQRLREAAIRPLSSVGQTRVWNLFFDVVVQTGRFSTSAASLAAFSVEGEKRYWVHVAIDRMTGQVIDKQMELVSE